MPELVTTSPFDRIAAVYDRLVDWPIRLAREGPFFRDLFERYRVRRVLDAACGTGRHAAMFHSWGMDVVGTDVSPVMLAECARLHGTDVRLNWRKCSFTEPVSSEQPFDAVVCLGNSLGLTGNAGGMETAVRLLTSSLRPGGVGVIQLLNLHAIPEGPTRWQKVQRYDENGHSTVLLKGVHRVADRGFVDLVELCLPDQGVEWQTQSASFWGVTAPELCRMIGTWGGEVDGVYGTHGRDSFDEARSSDLIVTWWRGRCG